MARAVVDVPGQDGSGDEVAELLYGAEVVRCSCLQWLWPAHPSAWVARKEQPALHRDSSITNSATGVNP